MGNYLALDLGTKTGFCVFREESGNIEFLESGTKNLSPARKAPIGRRFVCFRDWLLSLIKEYDIKTIYYEQVFGHTGVQASHIYGGFLYHLAAICDDLKIPLYGIGVCTIKKCVTGYGHADKNQVICAVRQWNLNPIDDNQADAIAIALTVQQLGGTYE